MDFYGLQEVIYGLEVLIYKLKEGLFMNNGLEITRTTSNLREVGLSWESQWGFSFLVELRE